jgi:hypothetical protein
MKFLRMILLPAVCAVAAASATTQSTLNPYETVARKSIFSRDRVSRSATTRSASTQATIPSSPVVTGILREDVGYVAVLESPGSGRPVMVHLGESLPGDRGIVTEMNLDCFVFVPAGGGAPRKAYVGRNLDGAESTLVAPTTGPSDALIEGDDIVSRMRRRRQQEGK